MPTNGVRHACRGRAVLSWTRRKPRKVRARPPAPARAGLAVAVELPVVFERTADRPEAGRDPQHRRSRTRSVVYYNGQWHVFASTANASGVQPGVPELQRLVPGGLGHPPLPGPDRHRHRLPGRAAGVLLRAAEQVVPGLPDRATPRTPPTATSATRTAGARRRTSTPRCRTSSSRTSATATGSTCGSICDSANCYLFSSDDNGHLYRSADHRGRVPERVHQHRHRDAGLQPVHPVRGQQRLQGRRAPTSTCCSSRRSARDGRRYFRSWTADGHRRLLDPAGRHREQPVRPVRATSPSPTAPGPRTSATAR